MSCRHRTLALFSWAFTQEMQALKVIYSQLCCRNTQPKETTPSGKSSVQGICTPHSYFPFLCVSRLAGGIATYRTIFRLLYRLTIRSVSKYCFRSLTPLPSLENHTAATFSLCAFNLHKVAQQQKKAWGWLCVNRNRSHPVHKQTTTQQFLNVHLRASLQYDPPD